ncbi:hypothetical protein [Yinghuangia seranimata]|uniref:hypothetical protein n=1 Tax=Yinghuangia seranimata TaxID=408067 RepID=UPI00248B83C0|nr:hypothetical protein [Yinghuangia seranimata]MDI2127932.1 hypothetical protein [Yinghuangia seranimata]
MARKNPAKLPALVVAAAALLAMTAGCSDSGGGDDKNKQALADWAAKVCTTDVTGKIDESKAALADMNAVVPKETPDALKARLAADVTKLADADTALAVALDNAGDPVVKNGKAQAVAAAGELRAAATGWNGLKTEVEALPTTDQKAFADALRALQPNISKYTAGSRSALEELHKGELGKALAATPGCAATVPAPAASTPAAAANAPVPAASAPAPAASTPAASTPAPSASTPVPAASTPAAATSTPAPAAT